MRTQLQLLTTILLISLVGCSSWLQTRVSPHILKATSVLPDGSVYDGDIRDGMFNGHGRLVWPGGAKFEGEFVDGQMSGQGKFVSNSGDVYQGSFENGMMAGAGKLVMIDGSVYTGEFLNDRFDGEGHWESDIGVHYQGEFQHGYYNGVGKLVVPDQTTYVGEFEHGNYSGEGELVYQNGNRYEGWFKKNLFDGHGKFSYGDGSVYVGTFVKGEFTGSGIYQDKAGNTYSGEFKNWEFDGQGEYSNSQGATYNGHFKEGVFDGEGVLQTAEMRYSGEFENGAMTGRGVMTKKNGDRYSGQFDRGLYHGQGELVHAEPEDGVTKLVGEWRYGEFVQHAVAKRNAANRSVELALYNQSRLLDDALKQILPSEQDKVNLYFVGVAGYGDQDVFMKEVDFIKHQFDTRFQTRNRSVVLVNNTQTVASKPMATSSSIERTLKSVASKMDPNNDILFLYLTSHGSDDHQLSIVQQGLDLSNLSAKQLASMLEELPVRWKVVVVSACYSGGFIPQLKNESTLIMTAASHDKKSFGCGDDENMTYFGRAFFKEALPTASSFNAAFDNAKELIYGWEESYDYHSNPQKFAPMPILAHLKKWREQMRTESISVSHSNLLPNSTQPNSQAD